ncbi:stage V sporulation protein AD [Mediterraneibacter glycyrrhizinilyticus]|nr:stage V sporulation protein AD [Mediterraneibacter glycyrrhizinilyticus]MBM6802510.1 stage V sporulation protein AD [Mediterraneibacter glycyrrhizinilyticus]
MNRIIKGKQSLLFENAPYIVSAASVTGSKEAAGPLGKLFDMTNEDDLFGAQTWEEAESTMQKEACVLALGKAHVKADEIRYLFGGDLLRQGIATSMGVEALQIPMFGLYGACSTSGEALALAGMSAAAGYGKYMLAVTSSHFGSAEKEFRFPLGYANQRPLSAHWTVTGSGAFLVRAADATTPGTSTANIPAANIQAVNVPTANNPAADLPETSAAPPAEDDISTTHVSHVRIAGVTVGKIVDYGLKDSQNMGACMAPAAMDTIVQNFEDFGRSEQDYDRIITGDLGYVGQSILFDLVRGKGYDIRKKHLDCGMTIYDQEKQDTHAGGSGCGCAAVTLASFIIPKIEKGEWKRVLFVPTGALMSTVSFNEGASVPGIAHGIVLEHWPQAQ